MSNIESLKYKASALQLDKAREMYKAGFVRNEIKYILMIGKEYGSDRVDKQFDNDKYAESFDKMIAERIKFIDRQRAKGYSRDDIRKSIKIEYEMRRAESPYSLLKDEYRPNPKPRLDFNEGVRKMRNEEKKYNYKR